LTIAAQSQGLSAIVDLEALPAHARLQAMAMQLSSDDCKPLPKRRATLAYTLCCSTTANSGDLLDLHVALAALPLVGLR